MVILGQFTAIESHEEPVSAALHVRVVLVADLVLDKLLARKLLKV